MKNRLARTHLLNIILAVCLFSFAVWLVRRSRADSATYWTVQTTVSFDAPSQTILAMGEEISVSVHGTHDTPPAHDEVTAGREWWGFGETMLYRSLKTGAWTSPPPDTVDFTWPQHASGWDGEPDAASSPNQTVKIKMRKPGYYKITFYGDVFIESIGSDGKHGVWDGNWYGHNTSDPLELTGVSCTLSPVFAQGCATPAVGTTGLGNSHGPTLGNISTGGTGSNLRTRLDVQVRAAPTDLDKKIVDQITVKIINIYGDAAGTIPPPYTPSGQGSISQLGGSVNGFNRVTYNAFTEPTSVKDPKTIFVQLGATFHNLPCGSNVMLQIDPVFKYVLHFRLDYDDYQAAITHNVGDDDYNSAAYYARAKYGINTSNLSHIYYDSSFSGYGYTSVYLVWSNHTQLGDPAFADENVCASTMGHENVHGGQSYTWQAAHSEQEAELPAYQWEEDHKGDTGLSATEVSHVEAWLLWCKGLGPRPI